MNKNKKIKNIVRRSIFFIPGVLVFLFIFLYPLIKLAILSFQNINLLEKKINFFGIQNYIIVLRDSLFLNSLKNNLILVITVIPILIFLCVIFSVILFHSIRGLRFYQIIVFSPYLLSVAVTGVLFSIILQINGPMNEFFRSIGLNFIALDWLGNTKLAIFTIAFIIIWREMGFGITLFLARLLALSKDLEDAIEVDGANWWRKLINLYIPHLKGIMVFYIVIVIINLFNNVFSYIYVITKGGPANSTTVFEYYAYTRAFLHNKITLASAASVLVFVVLIFVIFMQIRSGAGIEEEG